MTTPTTPTDDERFKTAHPDIPPDIKRFTYCTPGGHILESWERDPVTHLWTDTTLRDQMRERLADAQEGNTPHTTIDKEDTTLAHLLQGDTTLNTTLAHLLQLDTTLNTTIDKEDTTP